MLLICQGHISKLFFLTNLPNGNGEKASYEIYHESWVYQNQYHIQMFDLKYQWFNMVWVIFPLALSDETRSRDHFWDQNGLKPVSRPFWDQNVTLSRVTRLVSRPDSRPKWSQFRSRDQYQHQNVTLCLSMVLSNQYFVKTIELSCGHIYNLDFALL